MNILLSTGPILALAGCLAIFFTIPVWADPSDKSGPVWEPLLWGGPIPSETKSTNGQTQSNEMFVDFQKASSQPAQPNPEGNDQQASGAPVLAEQQSGDIDSLTKSAEPVFIAPPVSSLLLKSGTEASRDYVRAPFRMLALKHIPPLYVTPIVPGEGLWDSRGTPMGGDGSPIMFKTSYRPSVEFPNAIVHMLLLDMKKLSMRLYIGSSEPGATSTSSVVEREDRARVVAVTNAMWKQKHSGEGGTIHRGKILKKLAPGLATLVVYKSGSVDILEWNDDIPVSEIQDAKQLRHLIVNDGKVVTSVTQGGRVTDSEIGLGYLLVEDESQNVYRNPYQYWGGWWGGEGPTHTSGEYWFLATRSAFGIRNDGNLVFAIGHHIGTKDMAKALVLAGCQRAIHGDANPHNVVGNLYYNDGNGNCIRKEKLSPDQKSYTLDRYVDRSYSSDFFAFFVNRDDNASDLQTARESELNTTSASVSR